MTTSGTSMIGRETLYGIQLLISILGIPSNGLREDSEKVLNTENIVLSMKDFNEVNVDDLEIIKNFPGSFAVDKKLRNFHKLIRGIEARERDEVKHGLLAGKPMASHLDQSYGTVSNQVVGKIRKKKRRPQNHGRKKLREKRSLTPLPLILNTYSDLESQYENFVAACQRNNIAYKYTDEGKPEENIHDAISKIMELNFPRNCINITGAGFNAIKCLIIDIKNGEINNEQLINKVSIILFVWISIFLVLAMILWCAKGWCCCCFRCSFCFPNKTIRDIQKYLKENPPGFYRDKEGKVERYHASAREKELYEILTKSVEQY